MKATISQPTNRVVTLTLSEDEAVALRRWMHTVCPNGLLRASGLVNIEGRWVPGCLGLGELSAALGDVLRAW